MGDWNKMRSILKWMLILSIAFSLALFIYRTDGRSILENLEKVGFGFLWIIAITFFAHLFGALSWSYTLPSDRPLSFFRILLIRFIGENLVLVNPANIVGGDSFKAYLLQKEGVSFTDGISSLFISRMIMMAVQIGLFLLAAFIYAFFAGDSAPKLFRIIAIALLVKGVLIFLIFLMIKMARQGRLSFIKKWIEKAEWTSKIIDVKNTVHGFYTNNRNRFYKAVSCSVANFLVGSLEILLLFYYLNIDISYLEALLIDQGVLFFKSFGAFIPGQLGAEEYANKLMLAIVGIKSLSIWIAISILRRARQLFWLAIATILYYFIFIRKGKSISGAPVISQSSVNQ